MTGPPTVGPLAAGPPRAGPARLAPLPASAWNEEARALLRGHLDVADKYLTGTPDAPPVPNILGILARHGRLGSAWIAYNAVLLQAGSLPATLRELLVLRVAHRAGSRYEWLQHRRIGREAGLTEAQLDAVTVGPASAVWTPLERLLLTAADQLLESHVIEEATWYALAAALDEQQLLEVPFVVGSYLCLALVFNSVALQPDPQMEE